MIAGVESFDAQFAEENHHDATNWGFLRGFHSENARRATSRSLAHEQQGENHQRATRACDAYTLTLTLTLTLAQVRTTKERLKPVMVALNDACCVMRQRAIEDKQEWPANVTPIPVGGAKKKTGSVRATVPSPRHHPTSNTLWDATYPVGRGWRLRLRACGGKRILFLLENRFSFFWKFKFHFAPIWLLCFLTYYHYSCAD